MWIILGLAIAIDLLIVFGSLKVSSEHSRIEEQKYGIEP